MNKTENYDYESWVGARGKVSSWECARHVKDNGKFVQEFH